MPSPQDLLRRMIPLVAAALGFLAGLIVGALAEIAILPLLLLLAGLPHPLRAFDESFRSDPPGALALITMTGYLTAAFLGAFAAYAAARRFTPHREALFPARLAGRLSRMRRTWSALVRRRLFRLRAFFTRASVAPSNLGKSEAASKNAKST